MNKKPNILFLFPDQHRREWINYPENVFERFDMKDPKLNLPNISYIQSQGVTFTNAVTPSPLCAPARACLALGTRYFNCETFNNEYDFPVNKDNIYKSMKNVGYEVCGVGKFDLQKKTCNWFDYKVISDIGFTNFLDNEGKLDAISFTKKLNKPAGPYTKFLHENNLLQDHLDDMQDRKRKTNPTTLPDFAYCDNWITNNAIEILKDIPNDKPWFMQINFTGPHDPFDITKNMRESVKDRFFDTPPECLDDDNEDVRRNYAAMIENIDRNIGLILDLLKEKDELSNTIIVYASDHGEMLGDLNRYSKGVAFRGSINIPLIISMPNCKRKGEVDYSLIELQDLAKTFADFAEADFKSTDESLSLLPILNGCENNHRDYVVSALYTKNGGFKCILDNDYKYVINSDNEQLLFNVKDDVWEKNNVLSENLEVAKKYFSKLNCIFDGQPFDCNNA